jgi:hypothetical protein
MGLKVACLGWDSSYDLRPCDMVEFKLEIPTALGRGMTLEVLAPVLASAPDCWGRPDFPFYQSRSAA